MALGIAEAIEASVMHSQFVTVPILDARLQELKGEARVAQVSLESKLQAGVQELEAKFERRFAELETKMESIKAELVRWVFLTMLGNVALTAGVSAVLNAFKNL